MPFFEPTVDDTPEDRGRLAALEAEAIRDMAAFSMARKSRLRRIGEDLKETDPEFDEEAFEDRMRKKRKGGAHARTHAHAHAHTHTHSDTRSRTRTHTHAHTHTHARAHTHT